LGRLSKYDLIPAPETEFPAPFRADKYPLVVAGAELVDPLVKKKSGVSAGSSLAPLVKKNGGSAAGAGAAERIAGAAPDRDSRYEREYAGTTPKARIAATVYFIVIYR